MGRREGLADFSRNVRFVAQIHEQHLVHVRKDRDQLLQSVRISLLPFLTFTLCFLRLFLPAIILFALVNELRVFRGNELRDAALPWSTQLKPKSSSFLFN